MVTTAKNMNWTEKDEIQWRQLSKLREKNRFEVGRLAFIQQLRNLADAVESGKTALVWEIKINYVRRMEMYAFEIYMCMGTTKVWMEYIPKVGIEPWWGKLFSQKKG